MGWLWWAPLGAAALHIAASQVSMVSAAIAAVVGGSYHLWAALAHRWRARQREPEVRP